MYLIIFSGSHLPSSECLTIKFKNLIIFLRSISLSLSEVSMSISSGGDAVYFFKKLCFNFVIVIGLFELLLYSAVYLRMRLFLSSIILS